MPLKIYNTQSRQKEEFKPLNPPRVSLYVCGVTVYDYCHLGHARATVVFDIVFRYLQYRGYQVHFVRNFTDIDDKIIRRSQEAKVDWRELTAKFIEAFHEDMKGLGNLPPSEEPKATDYIATMQDLIARLVQKNLAYPAEGDVFFSVRNFKNYGALAHKNLDDLESGARIEVQESKENPLDFALWKAAKPGEPQWDSPWGPGRPGWHIECSAMSTKLLGDTIDIHGGGRDLIFPHHENEKAQSEGATDKPFVGCWIHNGFVNLNADKMSKSTGNILTIREVLQQYPSDAIRYFLLSAHYRSPLDFTEQNMKEASTAVERVYQALKRWGDFQASGTESSDWSSWVLFLDNFENRFQEVMDDDFNTAQALALCFDWVRELNKFLDANPSASDVAALRAKIQKCLELPQKCLGVFTKDPSDFLASLQNKAKQELQITEVEILQKIQERKDARQQKNFALADQVRQELDQQGVLLKDKPDGTTDWFLK